MVKRLGLDWCKKRIWLVTWACANEQLSNESEVWCSVLGCPNRPHRDPLRPFGAPCYMTRRWSGGGSSGYAQCGLGKWSLGQSSSRSVQRGFGAGTAAGADRRVALIQASILSIG